MSSAWIGLGGDPVFERFTAPRKIAQMLADFPRLWAFAGGWAIDLYLDCEMRVHKDVDVAVLRMDQLAIRGYLVERGWTVEKAVGGKVMPWPEGEALELPTHILWCTNAEHDPDFLEILFEEATETTYRFRRDQSLTLPLDRAYQWSPSGLRIVAPEIALLYKAKQPELEGADADFRAALPRLSPESRCWLRESLVKVHPGHAWIDEL